MKVYLQKCLKCGVFLLLPIEIARFQENANSYLGEGFMKKYFEPQFSLTKFDDSDVVMASVFGAFATEWLNVFDNDWTGENN